MDLELRGQARASSSPRQLTLPFLAIVAAVGRPDTEKDVALLSEAGFARDRIAVTVVEDVPRLEEPLGGTGLHRYLVRLRLVKGDNLDELEQERRALMNGHALIQVLVHGDEERQRALAILSRHGGHTMGSPDAGNTPGRRPSPTSFSSRSAPLAERFLPNTLSARRIS